MLELAKKTSCILLALVLLFCMTPPAFAAEKEDSETLVVVSTADSDQEGFRRVDLSTEHSFCLLLIYLTHSISFPEDNRHNHVILFSLMIQGGI